MDESVRKNIEESLKVFANKIGKVTSEVDLVAARKVYEQCSDVFKSVENIPMTEEFMNTLFILAKSVDEITDLQRIALSKEIAPALLVLTKEQELIRKKLTKVQAKILADSKNFDIDGSHLTYKSEKISSQKVSEAIEMMQIFDDLSIDEIVDFSSFLYKYPYLAVMDPVGNKILETCENIDDNYITVIGCESEFFRARVMKDELEPFSEQEMRMAPFKIPGQGRFNTQGVSRFYLTECIDDAVNEVRKHSQNNNRIQVARYKCTEELCVLDLQKINNNWSKKCLNNVPNPGQFNVEYLYGGFLAQCLEYYGQIDGIMYGNDGNSLFAFFEDRKFIINEMIYTD